MTNLSHKEVVAKLLDAADRGGVSMAFIVNTLGVTRPTIYSWAAGLFNLSEKNAAYTAIAAELTEKIEAAIKDGRLPIKATKLYQIGMMTVLNSPDKL